MGDYNKYLGFPEWRIAREIIAQRDHYKCIRCHTKGYQFVYIPEYIESIKPRRKTEILIKIENNSFLLKRRLLHKEFQFIQLTLGSSEIEGLYSNVITGRYPQRVFIIEPHDTSLSMTIQQLITEGKFEVRRFMLTDEVFETFYKLKDLFLFGKVESSYDEFAKSDHLCFGRTYDEIEIGVFKFFIENIKNGLNIHHKLYTQNRLPWEYPESDLITLCTDCHRKAHESN